MTDVITPEPPTGEDELRARVLEALTQVLDPEIGINIVDVGLVYGIEVHGTEVSIALTVTSPACPLGEQIIADAEQAVRSVGGVSAAEVHLVWDPPWSPERLSAEARAALGWQT
jgi:metal-sulfur cluster biosynthetic enzyme